MAVALEYTSDPYIIDGREDELRLLNLWRENNDQKAYKALYDFLMKGARFVAHGLVSSYPNITAEFLYDHHLVGTVIRNTIERKYDPARTEHRTVKSFAMQGVRWRMIDILQRKRTGMECRTFSADAPMYDDDGPSLLDTISGSEKCDEGIDVLTTETRSLLNAVAFIALTPRRLQLFNLALMDQGCIEIARATGSTPAAVFDCRKRSNRRILKVLTAAACDLLGYESGTPVPLSRVVETVSPAQLILHNFMPGICLKGEDFVYNCHQLAKAGVEFAEDGRVDLRGVGDNKFNISIFKMADGSYKAGYEFLLEAKVQGVCELFSSGKSEEALCIMPEDLQADSISDDRGELSKQDYIQAARNPENIAAFKKAFVLHLSDEGVFESFVRSTKFDDRKWFVINGNPPLTGLQLLRRCGYSNRSQKIIKELFELILDGNIDFKKSYAGMNAVNVLPRPILIEDLKNYRNKKVWGKCGLRFEGEKAICDIKSQVDFFAGNRAYFYIDNPPRPICAKSIFKKLGYPLSYEGIYQLCVELFGDSYELVHKDNKEYGEADPKIKELFLSQLRKGANREKLLSMARKLDDKRLAVEINTNYFDNVFFYINGVSPSRCKIERVLFNTGYPFPSRYILAELYKEVFPEYEIVTGLPPEAICSDLSSGKNREILLDRVVSIGDGNFLFSNIVSTFYGDKFSLNWSSVHTIGFGIRQIAAFLNKPFVEQGLLDLYRDVFPEYKFYHKLPPEILLRCLISDDNMRIFEEAAKETDGDYIPYKNMRNKRFRICVGDFDKEFGIRRILAYFNLPLTKEGIEDFYMMIVRAAKET